MTDEVEINDETVALNLLKTHNIPELGNGYIVHPWQYIPDEGKKAVLYLCDEWDFAYVDTSLVTQKIKSLSWQSAGMGLIVANTPFGAYGIEPNLNPSKKENKFLLSLPVTPRESIPVRSEEDAKERATIDFAQRVKACTEPLVTEE